MEVKQFYDKALAHASYAIVSEGQAALIDPSRDPQPYLDFARRQHAEIVAVFETHPHADFVSSHLEFHQKHGATIYVNHQTGVAYPTRLLEDGDQVRIGQVILQALHTPGHSPDHTAFLLLDEAGQPHSIYTGDSLFVGDVGRPDLREGAGHLRAQRLALARQMYHTIHHVFKNLNDHITVYPAHGAGSLCGKNLGPETYSTIGQEKKQNWAFQVTDEQEFIDTLLADQPFVPQYFAYDVEVNRQGAPALAESIRHIPHLDAQQLTTAQLPVVDVRLQTQFKAGHLPGALNIQEGEKFETWLGALVAPQQAFYLVAADQAQLDRILLRIAKIGYESFLKGALVVSEPLQERSPQLDLAHFRQHPEEYTIVDVRNASEARGNLLFQHAINIPLAELPHRWSEIPSERPIVVHCAGGYRSAAGASIVEGAVPKAEVYDLSEAVKEFQS